MSFTHRSPLVGIILTCLLLMLAVNANAEDEIHRTIQAAYDRMSAAVEKKDVNGATAYYTQDFEMIERNGRRNGLADSRHQLQALFGMLKNIKAKQSVRNIAGKGNLATAIVSTHIEAITIDPRNNKPCKFVGDNVSQDVWVKSAKGWQQRRSQTLNERTLIDGKAP